ncbi:MAG: DUF1287 domain-containing protein [Thiolinea sp.]
MKKNNGYVFFYLLVSVLFFGVVSGCSNNAVKKNNGSAARSSAKEESPAKNEVVIINNGAAAVKDKHHIEYDKKRMWYNQQWVAKREAEQQSRSKAWQNGRAQAAQAQSARLPHYNLQGQLTNEVGQSVSRQVNTAQQYQRQVPVARSSRANVNLAEYLSNAAIARTYQRVRYDGRYIPISYPMGDVPASIGVCTDTVIRSYRRLGIDLQQLVHEDMSRAFHQYPNLAKWGLSAPDPNIDHRRVHNLKVFFARHGRRLPVTNNPADYRPGDLVTWDLMNGGQEHIGIVVNRRSPADPNRYMIVHNIANGDRMEDVLFSMPITGHYRYLPNPQQRWLASR